MNYYNKSASLAYQKSQTTTVDSLSLVIMLYEGAIRFLKQSLVCIDKKEVERAHLLISRSKDIVAELLSSLDQKKGGALAQNIVSIYIYIFKLLLDANLKKDKALVNEAVELLQKLLEGWQNIHKNNNPKKSNQTLIENGAALKNRSAEQKTNIYG